MWIDKVKEAKKKLDMSYREISIATNGKLSERDVTRLIKGEYKKPFVDDVIALGAAVKLTARDLFEEASIVVETTETAQESARIKSENERLASEVEKLTTEVKSLEKDISHLEALLAAKNELLAAKDQLLAASRLDKPVKFN